MRRTEKIAVQEKANVELIWKNADLDIEYHKSSSTVTGNLNTIQIANGKERRTLSPEFMNDNCGNLAG